MNRRLPLRLSTGIVAAPELPAGIRPSLRIFFSNHTGREATVQYRVSAVQPDGSLSALRSDTLHLPAEGGAAVELPAAEIEGERFEVSVRLPSPRVVASAALLQTALADGSTQLLLLLPPSAFTV